MYEQTYRHGVPEAPLANRSQRRPRARLFASSPLLIRFTNIEFHFDQLAKRLRELAFLNSGVCIVLKDERSAREETYSMKAA